MTGDFFQISPGMKNGQPKFAFEAEKWRECVERAFNLSKVFRQKDPRAFFQRDSLTCVTEDRLIYFVPRFY